LPDKLHPSRPPQIWANGDTAGANNRFWFPDYDFPNDKTTTEMVVTVPAGWEALSNGKLEGVKDSTKDKKGGRTFHWLQDKPHATYLVSLVAGEFDKSEEKWKVPVLYYVPRGQGANVERTFGRTTQMLDFFSGNIVPYPWAKYAQAAVDTFGGGMENTSNTTLGANAILVNERDLDDRRMQTDGLISHEMAHQWFGDLVTCVDWRHTWLNEGFATYFAALWAERAEGRDYFEWSELKAAQGIVSSNLRVAVVPQDGQDEASAYGYIYNKGGWTLHMVRRQLGDARFWKAIQFYTKKFSYQVATTSDFVEAISESTGQDLEWLFDQYVYRPGHPEFEVAWDYDAGAKLLHVALKQNQKGEVFRVPMEIDAASDSGSQTFKFQAAKESEDFFFSLPERPRTVIFDPRDTMLKAVNFKKPASEWIWQLEHGGSVPIRSEAAVALGAFGGPDVRAAVEKAGLNDSFSGIRIDAAAALGKIGSEESRVALFKIAGDKNLQVRAAAYGALGNLKKTDDTVTKLLDAARNDSSYLVRRSALLAAAKLKPEHGLELFKPFLDMDSPNGEIRVAAVNALELDGGDAAISLLIELTRDSNDRVRTAALAAFGSVGKGKENVTDLLIETLNSPEKGDRQAAIIALRQRKDASAVGPLERLAASEPLPNIARAARNTADALKAPAGPNEIDPLRTRLSELEKENQELKGRLDRLEKQVH
jgi:aminopeptidase N